MAADNFQFNVAVADESDDLNIIDGEAWLDNNPVMAEDEDRVSFEDSERFEDDSICSWVSENETLNQKWSEWRASSSSDIPGPSNFEPHQQQLSNTGVKIPTLADMAALNAAKLLSFDSIEQIYHHLKPGSRIPDDILKPILKRCFPSCPEDIRTYSFIANGSPVQFNDGMKLYEENAVQNVIQIGYHISSVVCVSEALPTIKGVSNMRLKTPKSTYNISIRVDRCRIVSCNCSCSKDSCWCQHVVAVCMQRIYKSDTVDYRGTIWDSITELSDEKLKKFAQYMINELPREYLPIAQRLIDELRYPSSEINQVSGAPDPTAGSSCDLATWCMDEKQLHESIRKILINFVKPMPTVHCDLNYLSATQPLASAELSWLMRTQLTHAPEPLWKLLEIVVHMLKRGDENATTLLHAITVHCLCVDQVLMWWYQTRLVASGHWNIGNTAQRGQCSQNQLQRGSANTLCEEIVRLWRLAALNPKLNPSERDQLAILLQLYHHTAVKRILRMLDNLKTLTIDQSLHDKQGVRLSSENAQFGVQFFPGFFPALQICHLDWSCSTIRNACREVNATEFIRQLEYHNSHVSAGISVVNLPILRYGTDCLVDELVNTEHQITTTLSLEEFFAQKARSKRNGKKKRRHRELSSKTSQNIRAQLRQLRLQMQNYRRRDDGEISEDSAAEDEEPEPSNKEIKRSRNPRNDFPVERETQEINELFAKAHEEMDNIQKLFACCESMVCYGFQQEAQLVAEKLTHELYNKPPKLVFDTNARSPKSQPVVDASIRLAGGQKPSYRPNPLIEQEKSSIASSPNFYHRRSLPSTLTPPTRDELNTCKKIIINLRRTLFVLKCLLKDMSVCPVSTMKAYDYENQSFKFKEGSIALKLAINALLNPRSPAPTKQMEVQILILEHELWKFLHTIQLSANDIMLLREVSEEFLRRDPITMCIRKFSVPPILFGHYILNALSFTYQIENNCPMRRLPSNVRPSTDNNAMSTRKPSDDKLAVAVALSTLQMKVKYSEKDYLMQCEWNRRQRGELAVVMLIRNNNSVDKLNLILDRFLDPSNHCIYGNLNTNAILVRSCAQNHHPLPFCTCWRALESGLNALTQPKIKSESQSRRNSDKVDLTLSPNEQTQFRLQRMGSSTSSVEPHEVNDLSSVASDSSNRIRNLMDIDCRDDCSSSRYSDSGSSGFCNQELNKFYNQVWAGDASRRTNLSHFDRNGGKFHHLAAQPSDDQVQSLMEIAKRFSPSGSHNSNIFHAEHIANPNNLSDPQLQLCGLIISLYALGINNRISDSWTSRTYCTIVSWIDAHIVDLGPEAYQIVLDTWETHFTPSEFLSLIEKVCMSADNRLLLMAPEMALSVLRKANLLTSHECYKALNICHESGIQHWEKACLLIEEAAQHNEVCHQVLFKVAENWYQIYSTLLNNSSASTGQQFVFNDSNIPPIANWNPPHFPGIQPQQNQHEFFNNYPLANQFYNEHHQSAYSHFNNMPYGGQHQFYCQPPPTNAYPPPQIAGQHGRMVNAGRPNSQRLHISHSAPNLQPALLLHRNASQLAVDPTLQANAIPLAHVPLIPPPPVHLSQQAFQQRRNEITPLRNVQIPQFSGTNSANNKHAYSRAPPPNQFAFNVPRSSPQWQLFKSFELGMKALDKLAAANPDKYSSESDSRAFSKYSKTPENQTDILALLKVSMQLGHLHVCSFCEKVTLCVESPFLLVYLLETALYSTTNKLVGSLNTEHVNNVHLSANRTHHQTHINFQLVGQQIQDLMLQFGYLPPYAELGRACAEMLYRATVNKLNYSSKALDANKNDLKELVDLADKFFTIFERCGPALRDVFLSTMRKQKNGRVIDDLIKEATKS